MRLHKICDTFGRVTPEEAQARDYLRFLMRLEYMTASFGDDAMRGLSSEFDRKVDECTPLSEIYLLLSDDQRERLRDSVEKPAVRMKWIRDGESQEAWMSENLHLLKRLEDGIYVGSVSETHIKRKPGDKAF